MDPMTDLQIQRALLNIHLRLYEFFTCEWAELAPFLVGSGLLEIVHGLEDESVQEHFLDSLGELPPAVLDDLRDTHHLYLQQLANYEFEFLHFSRAADELRDAWDIFLDNFTSISFLDAESTLDTRIQRLQRALGRFSSGFTKIQAAFNARFRSHEKLFQIFNRDYHPSFDELGKEELGRLMALLEWD